jgi:predicted  nucleic acid-binding Zn-ribbon protein
MTENLVLEILRRLQTDMTDLKQGQRSLRDELIGVRQQLHAMQGDILRQEQDIAGILVKLDRINTRLDLADT